MMTAARFEPRSACCFRCVRYRTPLNQEAYHSFLWVRLVASEAILCVAFFFAFFVDELVRQVSIETRSGGTYLTLLCCTWQAVWVLPGRS